MNEISTLFAVEAEQLLMAGLIDDAYEMCIAGLEAFPNYPSGYFVIAKCLIEKKDYNQASKIADDAIALFPANRQIRQLIKDIKESIEALDKVEIIEESIEEEIIISDIADEDIIDEATDEIIDGIVDDIADSSIIEELENDEISDYQVNQFETPEIELLVESNIETEIDLINEISNEEELIEFHDNSILEINDEITESIENENPYSNKESFMKLILNDDENNSNENFLKANNLDLIPGLESSPLKLMQFNQEPKIFIKDIPDFPPFTKFDKNIRKPKQNINTFSFNSNDIPNDFLENDPFNLLAKKLDKVKTPKIDSLKAKDFNISEEENPLEIMSITLAKIYEQQGAYQSAIDVYQKLMLKDQGNAESFRQEIEKLERIMELV